MNPATFNYLMQLIADYGYEDSPLARRAKEDIQLYSYMLFAKPIQEVLK